MQLAAIGRMSILGMIFHRQIFEELQQSCTALRVAAKTQQQSGPHFALQFLGRGHVYSVSCLAGAALLLRLGAQTSLGSIHNVEIVRVSSWVGERDGKANKEGHLHVAYTSIMLTGGVIARAVIMLTTTLTSATYDRPNKSAVLRIPSCRLYAD